MLAIKDVATLEYRQEKAPVAWQTGLWEIELNQILLSAATELVLELLNTSGGVNETLFTGIDGVRIHGDIANDHVILDTINGFLAARLGRGLREKIFACGNVPVANRMSCWMDTSFHDYYSFPC